VFFSFDIILSRIEKIIEVTRLHGFVSLERYSAKEIAIAKRRSKLSLIREILYAQGIPEMQGYNTKIFYETLQFGIRLGMGGIFARCT